VEGGQRYSERKQNGLTVFDGTSRLENVFRESVQCVWTDFEQALKRLGPPLLVLVSDGQALTCECNPKLRVRPQLRCSNGNKFLERLLFIVTNVGNQQGALVTRSISEVGRALLGENIWWQSVISNEMNRQFNLDQLCEHCVGQDRLGNRSGLVGGQAIKQVSRDSC